MTLQPHCVTCLPAHTCMYFHCFNTMALCGLIPALEYETVEVKAGRIMRVRSETVIAKFLSATFAATLSMC